MRGFSKVILAGNLTRDPEMRATPSGAQVCGFSMAVNRVWRGADGNQQEQVSFFDCSCWGKQGEVIAQYCKKGSSLIVSGRLEQRSWDDKTTGQKRSRVEVVVEDFTFVGGRNDDGGSYGGGSYGGGNSYAGGASYGGSEKPAAAAAAPVETVPEDIPDDVDLSEIPF